MATVVFFHAHPDDEALSTGGSMALLAEAGHRILLVLATRGEEGEPVPGVLMDGEDLADRRTTELRKAASLLGVARIEFLGYRDSGMAGSATNNNPDCFFQADVNGVVDRLSEILDNERVDLIVIYDPNGGYGHPDHIQVHRTGTMWAASVGLNQIRWVTLNRDAIREIIDSAIDSGSTDGLTGIGDDLFERRRRIEEDSFGSPASEITHAIDVESFIDCKREAIAAHESQISSDSFFLTMSDDLFFKAFGTEWFIDPENPRSSEGQFITDLFNI